MLLYSAHFAVWTAANSNVCWHAHLAILQTVMSQCYIISLQVSKRYAHMILVPVLGIAER